MVVVKGMVNVKGMVVLVKGMVVVVVEGMVKLKGLVVVVV